jgi:O-antigen/teichoic acid export membrane protein
MSEEEGDPEGLSSLASVSRGAGLFLVGRVVSNGVGFVTNVVLTRGLGAGAYGIYAYLGVVFSLLGTLTRLGSGKSVMRFLPEYEHQPRKRNATLTLAYGTVLVASGFAAAGVYTFAPLLSRLTLDDPLFVDVLRITAVVIPFNTLGALTSEVFRGVERVEYDVFTSSVVHPVLRLVFVGGAVVLGYALVGAAAGLVVSGVLTVLVALVVLARRTDLGAPARPTRTEAREYYKFSVPLTLTQLGNVLYSRVDILIVGLLLTGSAVGIYNVAVLLSRFLSLPLKAFNQLFPPVASRLHHGGDHAELESVYGTTTRLIFTLALFPAVAAVVYAPELLGVFGEEFTRGQPVLLLFVGAQVTNALVGPSGYLLVMSDHQYLALANQVGSGLLNVVLNFVLIDAFGFVGAALATASVLAGINLLRVAQVWYLEGYSPYDRSYLKPIVAAALAGVVMYGLSFPLQRYVLLTVGGAAGGVTFVSVLYVLGVEDDVELVRSVFG